MGAPAPMQRPSGVVSAIANPNAYQIPALTSMGMGGCALDLRWFPLSCQAGPQALRVLAAWGPSPTSLEGAYWPPINTRVLPMVYLS